MPSILHIDSRSITTFDEFVKWPCRTYCKSIIIQYPTRDLREGKPVNMGSLNHVGIDFVPYLI